MDDSLLEKLEGAIDNDVECTHWIEYYLDGELVHRSADVKLKKWPEGMEAVGGKLFGSVGAGVEGVKADGTAAKIG